MNFMYKDVPKSNSNAVKYIYMPSLYMRMSEWLKYLRVSTSLQVAATNIVSVTSF